MSTRKPAPVPVATDDQVDAWYRQGLLDPAQYAALTEQPDVDVDVDDDGKAAA